MQRKIETPVTDRTTERPLSLLLLRGPFIQLLFKQREWHATVFQYFIVKRGNVELYTQLFFIFRPKCPDLQSTDFVSKRLPGNRHIPFYLGSCALLTDRFIIHHVFDRRFPRHSFIMNGHVYYQSDSPVYLVAQGAHVLVRVG